jgi:hypothetical protein
MLIACYCDYKNVRHRLSLISIANLLLCEFGPGARNNQKSKRKQIAKPFNRIFFHQTPPDCKGAHLPIALGRAIIVLIFV